MSKVASHSKFENVDVPFSNNKDGVMMVTNMNHDYKIEARDKECLKHSMNHTYHSCIHILEHSYH